MNAKVHVSIAIISTKRTPFVILQHIPLVAVKVASDVLGFLMISAATFYIGFKNISYKGPGSFFSLQNKLQECLADKNI